MRIVLLPEAKPIVLSQNTELAQALEKAEAIVPKLQAQAQLEIGGFKLVCQSSTHYDAGRALYDQTCQACHGQMNPLGFTTEGVYFAIPIHSACDKVLRCPSGEPNAPGQKG